MEKALPMNENENLLWGKWKGTGVSEHQRSRLLIQHRLEERKKKEYECNRKNDEDQQRRADMQLLPFTKEERRLWRQWTRQGITGRDRRKLLKHERHENYKATYRREKSPRRTKGRRHENYKATYRREKSPRRTKGRRHENYKATYRREKSPRRTKERPTYLSHAFWASPSFSLSW